MTKEEKDLLLKDLSTRLLQGVRVSAYMGYNDGLDSDWYEASLEGIDIWGNVRLTVGGNICLYYNKNIEDIKPYLRPLSSMTDGERREAISLGISWAISGNKKIFDGFGNVGAERQIRGLDWLNAHHFDYRGLIEMGLALEAPEDMYKIE